MAGRSHRQSPRKSPLVLQPIDQWVGWISLALLVSIGVVLWLGDRTAPYVLDFSWHNRQINAQDRAFLLNFSRPMDRPSVERNLHIEPPLKGKFSWAGRRMAYTLAEPAPYGTTFHLSLSNAYDRFAAEAGAKTVIQPFHSTFRTPDPILAYIDPHGRLVAYDLKQQQTRFLTPAGQIVTDFRIYPQRDRILYGAIAPDSHLLEQKLYRLSLSEPKADPELVLDNDTYQNFKFDLAPDGSVIVVQRLHRQQKGNYGLWILRDKQPPQPLDSQPGGDFVIAPDSISLAMAQGEGIAILSLEPSVPPLDFLPRFGTLLSFSPSGQKAATIAFNKDFTRSLYLVTNTGEQLELARITGSVLAAQFDPSERKLYCLLTQLDPSQTSYQEEPYLAVVGLATRQMSKIADLPQQRNLQMHLSPDGTYLALSSVEQNNPSSARLVVINLATAKIVLTDLAGLAPRWFP